MGKAIRAKLLGFSLVFSSILLALWGALPAFAAPNITVVQIPNASDARVVSSSTDGRYLAYTTSNGVGDDGRILHQFDTQTNTDVTVAEIANGLPTISSDGQSIVFSAFGSPNMIDPALVNGAIYVWTADGLGGGLSQRVSPVSITSPAYFPSMSGDSNFVAWSGYNGTYLFNRSNSSMITLGDDQFATTQVSRNGAVVEVTGYSQSRQESAAIEYSTTDGSQLNKMLGRFTVMQLSNDGTYGAGFTQQTPTSNNVGITWFNFAAGTSNVLPNTADSTCVGDSSISYVSISGDGQTMGFGTLAQGQVLDPAGGSLGYFAYYPATSAVVNESGNVAQGLGVNCPSSNVSPDGNNLFFTTDVPVQHKAIPSVSKSQNSTTSNSTNMYVAAIKAPVVITTSTKLTVSPTYVVQTQPVTLTATIKQTPSGKSVKSNGSVVFSDGTTVLGIANVVSGKAVLTVTLPSYGSKQTISAMYSGAGSYASSWTFKQINVH